MPEPFQLSEEAVLDLDAIWLYLLNREGRATADRIIEKIFEGFHRLAENPEIGHRRADLTTRPVLFYRIFSYLVIYVPGSKPLQVLAVLHGRRNVQRLLRARSEVHE